MNDTLLMLYVDFPGPVIAPNSDLVFEVELIQVHDGPKPPNVFKMIDIDNDDHLTKDEVRNSSVDHNKSGAGQCKIKQCGISIQKLQSVYT